MAYLLCIETATNTCSVALQKNDSILSSISTQKEKSHANSLHLFIQELLEKSDIQPDDLSAIALSKGPGSYTGLRIGTATAKGLCFALDIPLVTIDTLAAMAIGANLQNEKNMWLCPMLDARRMEVYCSIYDYKMKNILLTQAKIIEENAFKEHLNKNSIVFFGDGMSKCKHILSKHRNAHFIENIQPSAENLCALAYQKFANNEIEDLAYFAPNYLKEYKAGKPKTIL